MLVLTACGGAPRDPPLPALVIDPGRIAVAGLSSGAYMATQAHLAYSDHLVGAGLIAGGPYGCARGELDRALNDCIQGNAAQADPAPLAVRAGERARRGELAPISGLRGDRVWVLHGTQDAVVSAPVSQASGAFYDALGAGVSVTVDGQRAFAHTLPTVDKGTSCQDSAPPFLGRCDYDAAGELMRQVFGGDIATAGVAGGQLLRFDQDRYRPAGKDAYLAASGYLYVPPDCAAGARCGLLIAFHGCQQNADKVGEAFVRDSGFNRWADAARVVVMYPQTRSSYLPLNPKACWDWWGFSGAGYDTREGVQLQWLARASAALGAPLK